MTERSIFTLYFRYRRHNIELCSTWCKFLLITTYLFLFPGKIQYLQHFKFWLALQDFHRRGVTCTSMSLDQLFELVGLWKVQSITTHIFLVLCFLMFSMQQMRGGITEKELKQTHKQQRSITLTNFKRELEALAAGSSEKWIELLDQSIEVLLWNLQCIFKN